MVPLEVPVPNLETSANFVSESMTMFSGYCALFLSIYGFYFSNHQMYSPHQVLRK